MGTKFDSYYLLFFSIFVGGFQCDSGSEELSPQRSRGEDPQDQTRRTVRLIDCQTQAHVSV